MKIIKSKNIIVTLLLLIIVMSCSSDDDNSEDNDQISIPVLSTVTINEDTVNAGSTVIFTVTTTDATIAIEAISLTISNPDGLQDQILSGDISTWMDLGNNSYSKSIDINEFAAQGEWFVSQVGIDNITGANYFEIFEKINSPLTFEIVNTTNEDVIAPEFTNITIDSININGGDELTFTVTTTDIGSGLDNISFIISNPEGEQDQILSGNISGWTDLGDNKYSKSIILNEFAAQGQWFVSFVSINDLAGNNFAKIYTKEDSPLTFDVINENPDTTSPVFENISIDNSMVNPEDTLTFTVTTSDENSGLDEISVIISNPNGEQDQIISGDISTWMDLGDNKYSKSIILNEFAVNGEWFVSFVSINDIANNNFSRIYNFDDTVLKFTVN